MGKEERCVRGLPFFHITLKCVRFVLCEFGVVIRFVMSVSSLRFPFSSSSYIYIFVLGCPLSLALSKQAVIFISKEVLGMDDVQCALLFFLALFPHPSLNRLLFSTMETFPFNE